jgi:hypothetical protein
MDENIAGKGKEVWLSYYEDAEEVEMERMMRLASGSLGQESQVLARNTNPTVLRSFGHREAAFLSTRRSFSL